MSPGALDGALPPQARHLLTPRLLRFPPDLLEPLGQAAPELRWRLVPYRAVGVPGGLLLAARSDYIEINGRRYPRTPVALSEHPVSDGGGYHALWGGEGGRAYHAEGEAHSSAGVASQEMQAG